jgi:hypothetical protein
MDIVTKANSASTGKRTTRTLLALNLWVETFEPDSGIRGRELPNSFFLGGISSPSPLLCFMPQRLSIWKSPIQALHGQGTDFGLGYIEPTTLFEGMAELQTRGQS